MIINNFLEYKLGVCFEDKYNQLAVEEIVKNEDKYPIIYDSILSLVTYDDNDNIKNINYDSSYFDCDDLELCAGYEETLELYKAFVRAFGKSIRNKNFKIDFIAFGVDYLRYPSVNSIINSYLNYYSQDFISVYEEKKIIGYVMSYFNITDDEVNPIELSSQKEVYNTFYCDNSEMFDEVKKGMIQLIDSDGFFFNRFSDVDIEKNVVKLDDNVYAYPYDSYELIIGKNHLKFFTTERGFDPLCALRHPILDSISEEEAKLEAIQRIKSIY
jgi:hypothetical protein